MIAGADDRLSRHIRSLAGLLCEPNALAQRAKWDKAFISDLWRVEALRTVDRLRSMHEIEDDQFADLVRDVQLADQTFAIHLATASVPESLPQDCILTYDAQLGIAGRSLGFAVVGVG